MTEIFTAKTVDEAKALAAKKFGVSAEKISFKVIEEGKKGFLGIGQVDAKVEATYAKPVVKEEIKAEVKTEAPAEIKTEAAVTEEKPAVKAEEPVVQEAPAEAEAAEEVKAETVTSEEKKEEEAEFSLDDYTLIEDESLMNPKVKIARDYITSILNAMEIDVNFVVYQNETGAVINLESEKNGTIIGRRGETLDAIQYLCSIIANKGDKEYYRITIDCLGYRSKRKDTLRQLAQKVAKSVLKTGRSQQLEPMNPYERRVIHSAVSQIEGVASRSEGDEPYRRIKIYSTNPKNSRGRGGRHRDDRRGGKNRDRRRENFEAKAIDLSTSFEKDYKKPKPEDSMEGGLYGKIEF